MRTNLLLLAGALLATTLAGCGGAAADGTVPLAGKVNYDGQPIEKGIISFVPTDGQGATAGAPIVNGAYATNITPGPKQVQVFSEKVIGKKPRSESDPTGEQVDDVQQIIPAKYNAQTTLTFTVPPGGNKTADFTLAK